MQGTLGLVLPEKWQLVQRDRVRDQHASALVGGAKFETHDGIQGSDSIS